MLKMSDIHGLGNDSFHKDLLLSDNVVHRFLTGVESTNPFAKNLIGPSHLGVINKQAKRMSQVVMPVEGGLRTVLKIAVSNPFVVTPSLFREPDRVHAVRFWLSVPESFARIPLRNSKASTPSSSSSTSASNSRIFSTSSVGTGSSCLSRCTMYIPIKSAVGQSPASRRLLRYASSSGRKLISTVSFYATSGAMP